MTLEERLDFYDRKFGFREHPEDFNFELSPEPLIYKNEALRNDNRDLYANYLADHFPTYLEQELVKYDKEKSLLIRLTKDEAEEYFNQKKFNLLESDLGYADPDAIFHSASTVSHEDLDWYTAHNKDDLIRVKCTIFQALSNKTHIYLIKNE